jgi:hypothetical protein
MWMYFSHSLSADEQKCHQKFLTMDYATARNAIPKRHDGTLEWVLRDNHCIDWVEDRTNFLWISGNPGAGKTGTIATLSVPI